ncbi:MAG: TolC family protein [Williamsia sp.]|nr:TolC family protein [Williamsia sp.]
MRSIFLFLMAALLANGTAYTQNKYTLQQCIDTALANSISLKQTALLVQTEDINWRQAKLNLLPDVNASISQGVNQGRSIDPFTNAYINQRVGYGSYNLNSSVVLFSGLSQQKSIRQFALSREAAQSDLQQAKDNLMLNVILAYLQVLSDEDRLSLASRQRDVSRNQFDRLQILDKEGAISPSQVSDIKGQLMDDELSVVNGRNALETSKLSLAQLMNIPYNKNMQLERVGIAELAAVYPATPDEIYTKALDQLALIRSVGLKKESARASVQAIRGRLYPSLVLSGNVTTNYSSAASRDILLNTSFVSTPNYVIVNGTQVPVVAKQSNYSSEKIAYSSQLGNNIFSTINLGLRIPLFNSLVVRNQIKQAKIILRNNELIEENTRIQLRQQIDQAYLNMTNALDRYKVLQEQVNAYNLSFKAAEVRFNAGVGNSVDYTIAKNNLDRATINLVNAQYDFLLRKKVLDYYFGTM